MSGESKTLPEWEEAIVNAYSGQALSSIEKIRFAERFFNFVKDPDRQYFSEYVGEIPADKRVESVQQHIYDFIHQSESGSASVEEVVQYIERYGHDANEVKDIIQKMVSDNQISNEDNILTVLQDPSLDSLDPEESDLESSGDDMEAFRDETGEDEDPESGISDDIAAELGIDKNDPFGDEQFLSDNESY